MKKNEPIEVKVGQVWADNDNRSAGRRLRVIAIDPVTKQAVVRPCNPEGQFISGRISRISVSRMRPTSTGYRFIKEVA